MAALTANNPVNTPQGPVTIVVRNQAQVASSTDTQVWGGAFVLANLSGYAQTASDTSTSGYAFIGIAQADPQGPAGPGFVAGATAGATFVPTIPAGAAGNGGVGIIPVKGNVTQAWLGQLISVLDSQTGQLNSASTNKVVIGKCVAISTIGATGSAYVDTGVRA